jgi:multiple sugar transport system substrate-binding protein
MFHFHNKHVVQWATALLVVLSLVLSGCAPQTTPTSAPAAPETQAPTEAPAEAPTEAPTEEPAAESVEMHISWWGSQSRHDLTIEVIEMFMAEHPNITITYDFASFGDYWTLMSTKAAGGNLPCVMQQDYAYFQQYVRDGLLIPLDPYVENGTIDLSNASVEAVDGGRVDGQLYALNLGTNSQSFVIDVDKFNEAGVDLPEPNWTWSDFEEVNMAMMERPSASPTPSPSWIISI